jgi:hypothetical protein
VTTYMPNLCRSCLRLNKNGTSCAAFPAEIPDTIIFFGADHRVPIDGDHGLQYLFDAKKTKDYEDYVLTKDTSRPK